MEASTHPGHVFSPVDDGEATVYVCECCKMNGNGKPLRCTTCPEFNLHPFCATIPETLAHFMHPDHTLTLKTSPEQGTAITGCNICGDPVEGAFYSCSDDFHVHPICTKFPEIIKAGKAPGHVDHELKAVWPVGITIPVTTCQVCRQDCTGFRYRCVEGCDVDLHVKCLGGLDDGQADGCGDTRGFAINLRYFDRALNIFGALGAIIPTISNSGEDDDVDE